MPVPRSVKKTTGYSKTMQSSPNRTMNSPLRSDCDQSGLMNLDISASKIQALRDNLVPHSSPIHVFDTFGDRRESMLKASSTQQLMIAGPFVRNNAMEENDEAVLIIHMNDGVEL